MNANIVTILGSALTAAAVGAVATITVITTQRPDLPTGMNEMTSLMGQMVNEQQLVRANIARMVEAQQEMLHRDNREKQTIQGEKNQAQNFFDKNMKSMGGSPNAN